VNFGEVQMYEKRESVNRKTLKEEEIGTQSNNAMSIVDKRP